MRKSVSIIIVLFVALTASAIDKRQAQVNDIKKNKEYLFSEATMPTQEEAASVAYEKMHEEVLSWLSDHAPHPLDTISLKEIKNLVDTFVLRRADMYRVFAYVNKDSLTLMFSEKESPKTAEVSESQKQPKTLVDNHVKQQVYQHFYAPKNEALRKIAAARNFFELEHILPPLKADGSIVNYGKLATAEKLEECYLIVYDIAGNIKALLGKGEKTRLNLKTGKEDSLENYRGCGAIWFTMKEKELKN